MNEKQTHINLLHYREQLNELICNSDQYATITTELHEKYKDQMVKDEYPEPYWEEHHNRFSALLILVMTEDPRQLTYVWTRARNLFAKLKYNGSFEELYAKVETVMMSGDIQDKDIIKSIIERLTVEQLEEIIQLYSC